MPGRERMFIIKMPDGTEKGPFDQRTVVKMAEAGEVTYECEIRNSLIPRWNPTLGMPFLKEICEAQKEEAERKDGALDKIKGRVTAQKEKVRTFTASLGQDTFRFTPASISLRIWAGLLDLGIALALALVLFFSCAGLIAAGLPATVMFYLGVALFYSTFLVYMATTLGLRAQTLGQQFWGIMIVRKTGGPVYLGRAFVFAVTSVFLGFLTPIFVYVFPSKRALPDMLSDSRVVRIRVVSEM